MAIDVQYLPDMLDEAQDYVTDKKISELLAAAAHRIRSLTNRARVWHAISTMPYDKAVLVAWTEPNVMHGDKPGVVFHWAIAKRRRYRAMVNWWRLKTEWREFITYADSYTREVEWGPTHWSLIVEHVDAPPIAHCLVCGKDWDTCNCMSDSGHTFGKVKPGDDLKGG